MKILNHIEHEETPELRIVCTMCLEEPDTPLSIVTWLTRLDCVEDMDRIYRVISRQSTTSLTKKTIRLSWRRPWTIPSRRRLQSSATSQKLRRQQFKSSVTSRKPRWSSATKQWRSRVAFIVLRLWLSILVRRTDRGRMIMMRESSASHLSLNIVAKSLFWWSCLFLVPHFWKSLRAVPLFR